MRSRAVHALLGVVATLVGLAAGHLVAALLDPASSPVLAVGSTVVDSTPTAMKEWAIRTFGSSDKLVLVGSVVVVVLLLSAVAGVLARTRLALGAGLMAVLVALAAAAALLRPGADVLDVVPALVTAVGGIGTLVVLTRLTGRPRRATAPQPGTGEPLPGASRRTVLVATGVSLAAAAVMGGAGRVVERVRSRVERVVLPQPSTALPPLPEGLDVPGITPFRVPNSDFYRVDTRLDVPALGTEDWTLTIDGDVDREVTFTFDEILAMEMVERDITLTCVSNSVGGPYVGGTRWLGVPLLRLLDMAGIDDTKADQMLATDFDGMTIGTPLAAVLDGREPLLAVGMGGEQLPREHGFPARVVIPGLYGFISATKWVRRITLTTYAETESYWTERGWSTDGDIRISSRIDTPRALADLTAGENVVGGVAWAQQSGGVAQVQVQVDGGPWTDAELGPTVGQDYWRQWAYRWDAEPGRHTISARVVDGDGNTQDTTRREPFPSGSSGIQQILVNVT